MTYGLSLAVIGASLQTRATAALFKGLSLSVMAFWVLGSTIYHTIILGLPSAEVMGGIAVLALTANLASVLMLMRYKDGDANVWSVWLCSRNDAIGNLVVIIAALGVWSTSTAWPDLAVAALMAGILSQLLRADPKAGLGGVPHRRPPSSRDGGLIGQMRLALGASFPPTVALAETFAVIALSGVVAFILAELAEMLTALIVRPWLRPNEKEGTIALGKWI